MSNVRLSILINILAALLMVATIFLGNGILAVTAAGALVAKYALLGFTLLVPLTFAWLAYKAAFFLSWVAALAAAYVGWNILFKDGCRPSTTCSDQAAQAWNWFIAL